MTLFGGFCLAVGLLVSGLAINGGYIIHVAPNENQDEQLGGYTPRYTSRVRQPFWLQWGSLLALFAVAAISAAVLMVLTRRH